MSKIEIGLIAMVMILAIVCGFLWGRGDKLAKALEQSQTIIAEKTDSIRYHVNDKGHIIAEKNAAVASATALANAYPEIVKELKDELNLEMKNVKALIKTSIQASGTGNATVNHYYHMDSLGKKYPYWELKASDAYMTFKASVYDSLHTPYHYTYTDSITTVIAVRKKWLLAKEQLYSTSYLKNPNARVTNSTAILVDSYKDKRNVVGIGVGYDPFHQKPVITIGVYRALFKF